MGLLSDLDATSPVALLRENSPSSLHLLKKYTSEQASGDEQTYTELVPELCERLQITRFDHDWLRAAKANPVTALQLEIAINCLENCTSDALLSRLVLVLSVYMNEHVPWSNGQLSEISMRINIDKCGPYMAEFASAISARLLSVTGHRLATVSSRRDGKSRFTRARIARPALGLQIPSSTEEGERSEWKSSPKVTALSSVLLLMKCRESQEYASRCASFTLNVLDDPDPLFRAQGCFLVQKLLSFGHGDFLARAGLLSVFEESIKTCLTYLPQLTPAVTSLHLLKHGAYPALLEILSVDTDTTYVTYLKVLDSHILASISHVSGRNSDPATSELLVFFFSQISVLVQQNLGLAILACFSRVNYLLCQTISNPHLIESENGGHVVEAALGVQKDVLRLCQMDRDEPKDLILQYRLDFLAAWAILAKRIARFGVGSSGIRRNIQENVSLLLEIANQTGNSEVGQELQEIQKQVPDVEAVFFQNGSQ